MSSRDAERPSNSLVQQPDPERPAAHEARLLRETPDVTLYSGRGRLGLQTWATAPASIQRSATTRPKFSVTRQRGEVIRPQFDSETRIALTEPSAFFRTSSTTAACAAPGAIRGIRTTSPGWTSCSGTLPRHEPARPRWRLPVFCST
jgi:hypothetical protein